MKVVFNWRYENNGEHLVFQAGDTHDVDVALFEWLNRDSPGCCSPVENSRALTSPPQHRMVTSTTGLRDIETITEEEPTAVEVNVSPAAAKLALQMGVNLALVQGTGSAGTITKRDVEAFLEDSVGNTG